ncbi:MAG TPA: hypothetical protein VHE99_05735 [Gammaproteobacteria bacterium]|nr:hypothetical protein [Gammaproteobacteria bacterium]
MKQSKTSSYIEKLPELCMKKITTKLRSSKKLSNTGSAASQILPLSPQEYLKKLNTPEDKDPADPLAMFKRDLLTWLKIKTPNIIEHRIFQTLKTLLQKKFPTLSQENLQHILTIGLKGDLYSHAIISSFQELGITISIDEFNELFLSALASAEFNNRAKNLKETSENYSRGVIKFGFHLLQAAIFYGKQRELINSGKPEINLTTRNGQVLIICTFKGPLGVRKNGPPAVFQLIPLEQPFEVEMQWTPKTGWTFHLPDGPEYQKLYEKLGINALVKFSSVYKNELIGIAIGLSLGGLGWWLHQDIDFSTAMALLAIGGFAVVVSGISSCIKYREELVE